MSSSLGFTEMDITSSIDFAHDGDDYTEAHAIHRVQTSELTLCLSRTVRPGDDNKIEIQQEVTQNECLIDESSHVIESEGVATFVGCLMDIHYAKSPLSQLESVMVSHSPI